MTLTTILKEKNANKNILLANYNLNNKKFPVGFININNDLIDSVLIDALNILPANFIISSKNNNFDNSSNISFLDENFSNSGFDFIVCDDCEKSIMDYLKNWVVPIIWKSHHISSILSEFDAAKTSWNAFIFEKNTFYDIYYSIIRYIENYKFPYDNKALVKNILDI